MDENNKDNKILAPAIPIIGIGASAGGLESLEKFFKNCQTDLGAAYVVIQHLSTEYKSMMDELLSRHTKMPVVMIEEGMGIVADTIYLIQAGTVVKLENDKFRVDKRPANILSLPIDIFFKSLALYGTNHAVSVILSGTGSDGTRGSVAINAAGGFVFAQQPDDAKFDGMPSSVIASGIVDEILPAAKIPERLAQHLSSPIPDEQRLTTRALEHCPSAYKDAFEGVLSILNDEFSIDFQEYKSSTINRRIERRMQVKRVLDITAYFKLLQQSDEECLALRKELLIPVTNFFRDANVFSFLQNEVVPEIVKNCKEKEGIRIWVAGCSTGEEPYSIAMLFLEYFSKTQTWLPIKIFATDVNPNNIEIASAGIYPESIEAELSPERLARFFRKKDSSFSVSQELRQTTVFAKHNLLTDAPFTRMNLVSCRNTLIYFRNNPQLRVQLKLQFATKLGGYLMLGTSESLTDNQNDFDLKNAHYKVFKRKRESNITSLKDSFVSSLSRSHKSNSRPEAIKRRDFKEAQILECAQEVLLENFAPPTMLVNEHQQLIHVFGDIQPFWQIRAGASSLSTNKILPDSLQPVASTLIARAKKNQQQVSSFNVVFVDSLQIERQVTMSVIPYLNDIDESFYLICFKTLENENKDSVINLTSKDVDNESMKRIDILEQELQATRESLQTTIEELETTNEELQATNEELMASNEELQSSNEELQSVNEELNTINAEFHEKVSILNRINADLAGMSKAAGIATLFIDQNANLTRYTSELVQIFRVRDYDIGRPLNEIVHMLEYPEFEADILKTLQTGQTNEKEVKTVDDTELLVRMVRYKIPTSEYYGVAASFIDISSLKLTQHSQPIIDALATPLVILDMNGKIIQINDAWQTLTSDLHQLKSSQEAIFNSYVDWLKSTLEWREEHEIVKHQISEILRGKVNAFEHTMAYEGSRNNKQLLIRGKAVNHKGIGAVVSHNIIELKGTSI